MTCRDYERYGTGYLYGELSQGDTDYMDRHMRICPSCNEELRRDREVQALFHELPIEAPPVLTLPRENRPVPAVLLRGTPGVGRGILALAASLLLIIAGIGTVVRIGDRSNVRGAAHSPVLSWRNGDEKGIETIRLSVDEMKKTELTYYDISKRAERRDKEETVVVLRSLETYDDEIKMLDRKSIRF